MNGHDVMETIVVSLIDSRLAIDGSVVEHKERVIRFSQVERVDHDVTLTSNFSSLQGVDHEDIASIAKGFKVHGRDSHDYKMFPSLAHDASDVVKASCGDGYNGTSTTYIINIIA